jgi:hypothetical protein
MINDFAPWVGFIVLLGLVLVIISRRLFNTLFAPLGLYALTWTSVTVVYWLMTTPPNELYYLPDIRVFEIVLVGMVVFATGCLLARVVRHRSHWSLNWPEPGPKFDRRLRRVLYGAQLGGFLSPVAMYLYARRLGIAGEGGDAARQLFIEGLGQNIGGSLSVLLGYAFWVVGFTFVMLGLVLALYAVFFQRRSILWLLAPVGCGVGIDYLQQGRYWAGVIAIVCLLAAVTHYHLTQLRKRTPHASSDPDRASMQTPKPVLPRRRFGWWRVLFVLAGIAIVAVSVFVFTAQRREGLAEYVERTIVLGPFTVPKAAMGPLLYVITPLASVNSYLADGGPSRFWYGSIGIWGLVDIFNYIPGRTRYAIIAANPQWQFDYHEPLAVGPYFWTNAYLTYFRAAMDDFGWLGLLIYPFIAGYVSTRLFRKMQKTGNLRDVCLWLLAAYVVVMTPLRWQLTESFVWGSGFLVVWMGLWIEGRIKLGLESPRQTSALRAESGCIHAQ